MKIELQYLSDSEGKTQAVQLPLQDWERLMSKLKKYEQTLKIKSDLKIAFQQVEQMRKSKTNDDRSLKKIISDIRKGNIVNFIYNKEYHHQKQKARIYSTQALDIFTFYFLLTPPSLSFSFLFLV